MKQAIRKTFEIMRDAKVEKPTKIKSLKKIRFLR